MTVVLRQID